MIKAAGMSAAQRFNELLTISLLTCTIGVSLSGSIPGTLIARDSLVTPPYEAIRDLHRGTLLVVLPTYQQKLWALERQIEEAPSQVRKQKLQGLYDFAVAERDSFQVALRQAVEQQYHFGLFDFVYDSDLRSSRTGQPDSAAGAPPEWPTPRFFLQRRPTESGADALVIMDAHRNVLQRPFPYYVRITRMSSFFDAFIGKAKYAWRDLDQVMAKLNRKLEHYHVRARPGR